MSFPHYLRKPYVTDIWLRRNGRKSEGVAKLGKNFIFSSFEIFKKLTIKKPFLI
jgi:hypothetical protein